MLLDDDGCPWDKTAWQVWRVERWGPACGAAGLDPVPRPYDLRHSLSRCCSRPAISRCGVARQAGHSLGVLLSTYASGHLGKSSSFAGTSRQYRYRDSNPGFRRERAAS